MQETVFERRIAELRNEMTEQFVSYEASSNARIGALESSMNTRLEKLEESVAGLILAGE